jgi:hypothetical protein
VRRADRRRSSGGALEVGRSHRKDLHVGHRVGELSVICPLMTLDRGIEKSTRSITCLSVSWSGFPGSSGRR